jgi:hypothetical protein
MPGRAQSAVYQAHKDHLSQRDGPYCIACFAEYGQKRGEPAVKLEIDHADNDFRNWAPENIHLVCKTHNLRFRSLSSKEHVSLLARYSAGNTQKQKNIGITLAKSLVDYMAGSPEMQVNSLCEKKWLDWVHEEIELLGSIPKQIAIDGGAQVAGCSTHAVRTNYLAKAISPYGPFQEIKRDGEKLIIYRPEQTH